MGGLRLDCSGVASFAEELLAIAAASFLILMRLLALETSGRSASAALIVGAGDGVEVVAEQETPAAMRSAQTLLPTVHALLRSSGWGAGDLERIAVAAGPGSFTGLRVGVVAAKTLAFALRIPLVGVNTLRALAEEFRRADEAGRVWAILDAQRHELFAAPFDSTAPFASTEADNARTRIVSVEQWMRGLAPGDVVTGPPLGKLAPLLPTGVRTVSHERWAPTATAVGRAAVKALAAGEPSDVLGLVPFYLRASAAEEKAVAAH